MRAILVVLLIAVAGCVAEEAPPAEVPGTPDFDPGVLADLAAIEAAPVVRFDTDHGVIDLLVYDAWMPETAAHFLALVDGGFYDNTQIHRIIPGFVIQGGDPTGTGTGGSGTTVVHEFDARLQYLAGGVGLARDSDPDSGDSQWFITTDPATRMSDPDGDYAKDYGTYAMFGQVISGIDVVRAIAGEDAIPEQDRPIVPILVTSAQRVDVDIDPAAYPLRPIEVGATVVSIPLHVFSEHAAVVRLEAGSNAVIQCAGQRINLNSPGANLPVTFDIGEHACTAEADGALTAFNLTVQPPLPA